MIDAIPALIGSGLLMIIGMAALAFIIVAFFGIRGTVTTKAEDASYDPEPLEALIRERNNPAVFGKAAPMMAVVDLATVRTATRTNAKKSIRKPGTTLKAKKALKSTSTRSK